MARTEIAGFQPQTYKTLQSEARKTAIPQRKINNMGIVQGERFIPNSGMSTENAPVRGSQSKGKTIGFHRWPDLFKAIRSPEAQRLLPSLIEQLDIPHPKPKKTVQRENLAFNKVPISRCQPLSPGSRLYSFNITVIN